MYYRLFAELFLFLRQHKPTHSWQVVVIYPNRNVEREQTQQFGDIFTLERVQRIYLDELESVGEDSLGVGIVKLVVESEDRAVDVAKVLIEKARVELTDAVIQQNIIDLIETIIVYKLPQKSLEEIAAMFNLGDLKQTRFYQEAFADGEQVGQQRGEQIGEQKAKLEAIPRLLKLGFRLELIAESLDLPLSVVQQIVNQEN